MRLLAEARRSLVEELLPGLSGLQRFQALMVANAMGIVLRDVEAGDEAWRELARDLGRLTGQPDRPLAEALPEIAAAIRAGRWDADAGLHEALRLHIRARLAVANPKALPEA